MVVCLVSAAAAACASGGGPSEFASADSPGQLPPGGSSSGAIVSDDASSNAMADGCPDGAEASASTSEGDDALAASGSSSSGAPDAGSGSASTGDDGAMGDDAADPDDAQDAGDVLPPLAQVPPSPQPGDLIITEIMAQPSGPEPESEWFEIYNQASSSVLLSGLTIEDGFLDTQVISSTPILVAQPGQYLVLVRSLAGAQAAYVPSGAIVYAYGTGIPDDAGIELDAGPFGELALLNGQTVLTDVPYGEWGVSSPGQSLELGNSATTQSDPSGWCIAQTQWAPGSDDGTPGAPSDCQ
jgi:hypothetical protein